MSLFAATDTVTAPPRRLTPAPSTPGAAPSLPRLAGRRVHPWLVASLIVVLSVGIYLITGPPHDGDLAAQVARADVFGRVGFVPWFAGWYSGLHLGGYSLVTPELMWWLKPAGLGVICLVLTEALAYPLLRAGGAKRAGLGAAALTVFQLTDLLAGRVTFAAGAVVLLAAVLAVEKNRPVLAATLALAASITSPVDGLVAILVAAAYLLHPANSRIGAALDRMGTTVDRITTALDRSSEPWPERRHLRESIALALGAGAGLVAVITLFPDPGFEPFSFHSMVPALLTSIAIVFFPVAGLVRRAAILSTLLLVACFAIHSPVGVNATRVALLMGLPAVVATIRGRRAITIPLVAALLVWPILQLRHDVSDATDPAAQASFYAPLVAQLEQEPAILNHRVEVVEPRTHWQVVYLEPAVTLARGWERQLDASLNPALYSSQLDAASYRSFLNRNAVALVAAPHGTPLDFGSVSEAHLIAGGLPYLHPIWSDKDWTLYAVSSPAPVASGDGAVVTALTTTGLRLSAPQAGTVRLRLRYSPYLTVTGGSVQRDSAGDAMVRLDRGGTHDLHAVWSWTGFKTALTPGDRSGTT